MCAVLALNSCVEYNTIVSELGLLRKYIGGGTLQKSILFTPRDPNAGPTGGDGDAWPAPTINLTIWFEVRVLRAMFQGFEDVENAGTCVGLQFREALGCRHFFFRVAPVALQERAEGLGLEIRVHGGRKEENLQVVCGRSEERIHFTHIYIQGVI